MDSLASALKDLPEDQSDKYSQRREWKYKNVIKGFQRKSSF